MDPHRSNSLLSRATPRKGAKTKEQLDYIVIACVGGLDTGKHAFVRRLTQDKFISAISPGPESPNTAKNTGQSMGFLSLLNEEKEEEVNHTCGFLSFVDPAKLQSMNSTSSLPPVAPKKKVKKSGSSRAPKLKISRGGTMPTFRSATFSNEENYDIDTKVTQFKIDGKLQRVRFEYYKLYEERDVQPDCCLFFASAWSMDSLSEACTLAKVFNTTMSIPSLLVVTKTDVGSLPVGMVASKASSFNIPYYLTSAKDDIQIRDVYRDILRQHEFKRISLSRWNSTQDELKDKLSSAILSSNMDKLRVQIRNKKSTRSKLGKHSWMPVHIAAWACAIEPLSLLIQHDPNIVNATNNEGWTPLHCAARMGFLALVKLLVRSGANVLALDNQNQSALTTGYYDVREYLQEATIAVERGKTIKSQSHIQKLASTLSELNVNMSYSKVCAIPALKNVNLTSLTLTGNFITAIPDDIHFLPNLEFINLFGNRIEMIPENMAKLTNLKHLDIRNNLITSLNSSIGEMVSLTHLLVGHNLLSFLPSQLGNLEKTLKILDIYGNPLGTIPPDVIPELGKVSPLENGSLFAYLNNLALGGEKEYNRVKVMFVGDGNVGKTSLINCFLQQDKPRKKKVEILPTDTIATDGIDIHAVDVPLSDTKDMTWDCWDYAGQEIYYTTHQFFLSPRSVYLICFNLLDRSLSKVEYWLNSIHARARGSPIIIVGTHYDDKEITTEYIEEVTTDLLHNIRPDRFKHLGVKSVRGIYTVGSKKRLGIRELMDGIAEEIKRCKFVGKLYPLNWINLEMTLTAFRESKTKPYVSFSDFERIAKSCQVLSENIVDALRFLQTAGVLCYFGDSSPHLKELIVLDPQFLTKVMSSVITIRHRYGQEGILNPRDLPHVWSDFAAEMRGSLMQLLEQFEVAFLIESTGQYVIPSLLPIEQPDLKEHWGVLLNQETRGIVLGRYYSFEFLPLGFFPRLFVRNYHLPDFTVLAQWRNGQVLRYKNITALFRYNPTSYTLKLEIHGRRATHVRSELDSTIKVLRILVENIDTIIEGWYETNISVTVPCSHCLKNETYTIWEFPLEQCMEAITNHSGFVLCQGVRKIRLDYLAPDLSFADLKRKIISFRELKLGKVIGEGAFGTVYMGFYKNQSVAIKELTVEENVLDYDDQSTSGDKTENGELKEKFSEFQREVWIMSCLDHSCVCGLIGVCMNPMAIVMDFLELGDLFSLYRRKKEMAEDVDQSLADLSSFPFAILAAYDVARGMEHLHSFSPPIIHRDLRSPNLFVSSLSLEAPSRIKVGDFGLSRLVVPSLSGGDFNANWLAPEVMKAGEYNGKMDVYSFAIVMWELITQLEPFEEYDVEFAGKPAANFYSAVIDGLRPSIPPSCDKEYQKLMEECWHGDPKSRPLFPAVVQRIEKILSLHDIPFEHMNDQSKTDILLREPGKKPRVYSRKHGGIIGHQDIVVFLKQLQPAHSDSVLDLVHIDTSFQVWAGTAQGEIVVWDTNTLERIRTITTTKKESFYSLCRVGDTIWAGCADGTISIYNIKDFKKTHELKSEHTSTIRAIVCIEKMIHEKKKGAKPRLTSFVFSGDGDGTLCFWTVKKKKVKPQLKQKNRIAAYIGSLVVHNEEFICVGTEKNILVLDSNLNSILEWKGHTNMVTCMVSFQNEVWSGASDGSIRVWTTESSESIAGPLTGHSSKVMSMTCTDKYIWSGGFDTSVLLWDPFERLLVQELNSAHTDAVRAITAVNEFVWSGSSELDAHICVWRHSL